MQTTMPIVQDTLRAGAGNCLAVGTRLADFEIAGLIGEGGFGIVYLAFDHSLQRTVAIKEYMPGAFASRNTDRSVAVRSQRDKETFETGLKSFINEARLLAQFDHPALIKVYRFWEENNTAYMAMRHYQGHTLKSVTRNDPSVITEDWLKAMLKPILEALEALYRVNVLHRDISPDNIMIQDNGEAVLLDFGAARQILSGMSHALTVILKPGYAPIEQYADDSALKQGPWTDIYSLSAVVYSALVKKPPPTSVARIIKDPLEPLQNGAHAGYSKEFLAAIDKGLAIKPEDRPQSIDEFRQLLQLELSVPTPTVPGGTAMWALGGSLGKRNGSASPEQAAGNAAPAATADPKPPFKRGRAMWIALALCVPAATAGYFAFERNTPPVAASGISAAAMGKDSTGDATAATATNGKHASDSNHSVGRRLAATGHSDATPGQAQKIEKAGKVEQATATIRVNVKPWGTIYVNGVERGVSPPLKTLVLPEGKHEVKVMNPNFPAHIIEIDVTKKKAGNIEYDFSKVNR